MSGSILVSKCSSSGLATCSSASHGSPLEGPEFGTKFAFISSSKDISRTDSLW